MLNTYNHTLPNAELIGVPPSHSPRSKAASAPKRASTAAPQPSRGQLPPRTRRVLMAGNWKMNPASAKEAQELAALLASAARTTAQASNFLEGVLSCEMMGWAWVVKVTGDGRA